MTDKKVELEVLEIRRTYDTTREKLFSVLSQPEQMSRWMNAGPDGRAEVASLFQVGGTYTVKMFSETDECISDTHGEYLEIELMQKIVCTWKTKGFVEHSVLSFEIEDAEKGVELVLRHQLPSELIEPHSMGWPNCLNRLATALEEAK